MSVLTPVAFRWEYFMAPAIALAVAPLADEWSQTRPRLLASAYLVSLGIQLALGWALLHGSFDIINVIIPSNRWPLLGPPWPHAPACDPSWPLVWW
jgi:hypothetical protein